MNYQAIALNFLKQNKPDQLQDLRQRNALNQFLADLEETYSEEEQTVIEQMTKNLPSGTLERARALNQAKSVARETTTANLTEFLQAL